MFEYLKGTLACATPQKAIMDVSGIGYALYISIRTFQQLPEIGNTVCFYTSFVVREDSQRLFGFLSSDERNFFESLNEISGIGPRLSLSILGHMSLSDLYLAVENGDSKSITKIPGIGKKMAERLILELKDKTSTLFPNQVTQLPSSVGGGVSDAIAALMNLGYKAVEAQKAVDQIVSEKRKQPPLAELISLALKSRHL